MSELRSIMSAVFFEVIQPEPSLVQKFELQRPSTLTFIMDDFGYEFSSCTKESQEQRFTTNRFSEF